MSLVADYGSSEESDEKIQDVNKIEDTDTEDDSSSVEDEVPSIAVSNTKLPSAKDILESGAVGVGVLKNPFKAAEDKKIASLEKHVKMVDTDANMVMKNGKKICWNYRKGRCRFGSACTFAHDSDVAQTPTQEEPKSTSSLENLKDINTGVKKTIKKKRPGLSSTLIPGKKVLKMYSNLKKS